MKARTSFRGFSLGAIGALAFALAVACMPLAAAADDDARAAAQELVDFTMKRMLEDTFMRMTEAMWPQVQSALPKTLDEKAVAGFRADYEQIVRRHVLESMKSAPDIYAQHFTADELRQLLAFYKTPLGNKMLSETPKVMAEYTNKALLPQIAPMQMEVQARVQALIKTQDPASK